MTETERLRKWLLIILMGKHEGLDNLKYKELKKQYLADEIWWVMNRSEKDFSQWLAYQALTTNKI